MQKNIITLGNVLLTTSGTLLVFSIGFLLQFFLVNIFSDCCEFQSLLEKNANNPFYFLFLFFSFLGSALFPSLIFSILINFHKKMTWRLGAIYGVISLCIYDISIFLIYKDIDLSISLPLNFIGGPLAGILGAYWARSVYSTSKSFKERLYNSTANILILFLTLILFFSTLFFFFLFPLPQSFIMNFKSGQSFAVTLEPPKLQKELKYKKDSSLEKHSKSFPLLTQFNIDTKINTLKISSMGAELKNPEIEFITNKKMDIRFVGLRGCKNINDAIKKIKTSPNSFYELRDKKISFIGIDSSLSFFQKDNASSVLYVPYKTQITHLIEEDELKLFSWHELTASIPLDEETYIFFEAIPDFIEYVENTRIIPNEAADFKKVTLQTESKSYSIPISSDNISKCSIADLTSRSSEGEILKNIFDAGFLIRVKMAKTDEFDVIKIKVPNASRVTFSDNINKILSTDIKETNISAFSTDKINANLKLGDKKISLDNEEIKINGNSMLLSEEDSNVRLTGVAKLIVINGKAITKSLFSSLDTEFQLALLTAFSGAIVWIIRFFRIKLLALVQKILFGKKIQLYKRD